MNLSIHKFRSVLKQWSALYGHSSLEETQTIIKKIETFKALVDLDKVMIGLFDPTRFRYIYLSENVAPFLGFTIDELINDEQIYTTLLKQITPHYYPSLALEFLKKMDAQAGHLLRQSMYIGGIKFKHGKSGEMVTLFVKIKILAYTEKGLPALGLHLGEDIGHLVKGNPMWCRCVYGDHDCVKFFSSGYNKEYFDDMVTDRELEVLKLMADNKDSKEIGQQLGISKDTVLKHRKNMLLKIGAKDSTALIHLCKLCDVL